MKLFSKSNCCPNIEIIKENMHYDIYDLMGNKIGIINNEETHRVQSLQQGIYILVGKDSKKTFIP